MTLSNNRLFAAGAIASLLTFALGLELGNARKLSDPGNRASIVAHDPRHDLRPEDTVRIYRELTELHEEVVKLRIYRELTELHEEVVKFRVSLTQPPSAMCLSATPINDGGVAINSPEPTIEAGIGDVVINNKAVQQ